MGIPVLGICYGLQLMITQNGGNVTHKGQGEYGFAKMHTVNESPLLTNLANESQVWMSHGDEIDSLGNGFEIIAQSSMILLRLFTIKINLYMVFNFILKLFTPLKAKP